MDIAKANPFDIFSLRLNSIFACGECDLFAEANKSVAEFSYATLVCRNGVICRGDRSADNDIV